MGSSERQLMMVGMLPAGRGTRRGADLIPPFIERTGRWPTPSLASHGRTHTTHDVLACKRHLFPVIPAWAETRRLFGIRGVSATECNLAFAVAYWPKRGRPRAAQRASTSRGREMPTSHWRTRRHHQRTGRSAERRRLRHEINTPAWVMPRKGAILRTSGYRE